MGRAFISVSAQSAFGLTGGFGKLAAIWFDELIIAEPFDGFTEMVFIAPAIAGGKLPASSAELLWKLWTRTTVPVPTTDIFARARTPQEATFLKSAVTVLLKRTEQLDEREDYRFGNTFRRPMTIRATLANNLIAGLGAWKALNDNSSCSVLPSPLERDVLDLCDQVDDTRYDTFRLSVEPRIPDLTSVPWDRVIELRRHPHMEAFRNKIDQVYELTDGGDAKSVAGVLDELEHRDLVELARLCRPAPRSAVLTAVASNIPLPIPLNPVSIAASVREVARQRRVAERFGWLYFLIDMAGDRPDPELG